MVEWQRNEENYQMEQQVSGQQITSRVNKQNDIASKQYNKLMTLKTKAVVGRTRVPALLQQRTEVLESLEHFTVLIIYMDNYKALFHTAITTGTSSKH